jgi:hypothetical protein
LQVAYVVPKLLAAAVWRKYLEQVRQQAAARLSASLAAFVRGRLELQCCRLPVQRLVQLRLCAAWLR